MGEEGFVLGGFFGPREYGTNVFDAVHPIGLGARIDDFTTYR